MAYDDFLVDKRVVERHIKKGLVNEDDLKRQIEALPDRESNLVHVSLEGGSSSSSQVEASDSSVEDFGDDEDEDDDDDEDDGDGEDLADEPQG